MIDILNNNKDVLAAVESIVTIAAICVGGWWTWITFVRKRTRYPSAKMEHFITDWADAERTFLHVTLRVTNTGNGLIPIAEACTWIEQLTPLPESVRNTILAGEDPVPAKSTEIVWTLLCDRKLDTTKHYEVEPGESDEFHFDFVIEPTTSRVLIYSHLENPKKSGLFGREKMGWNVSTVYAIRSSEKGT